MFQKYVPGSHLITVKWWPATTPGSRRLEDRNKCRLVASIVMNPLSLGRYAMSKMFVDPVTNQFNRVAGRFYVVLCGRSDSP